VASDWVAVGIGAVAAAATAGAAIAAWRSASAARIAAEILRAEREEALKERLAVPLMELRGLLAEYTIGIDPGQEGAPPVKTLQRQVKLALERSGLVSRLPKTAKFANATKDETVPATCAR
jgi:hypothetical protein